MQIETPRQYWWRRAVQRMSAKPWASRLMTRRLQQWDRWVGRLSKGRWTATEILTGLPVIFVTTIGTRSGQERTTPLLAIDMKGNFILIGTNFGAARHPQWYFNVKANPFVTVAYRDQSGAYQVTELEGEARSAAWRHAVAYYPGYQAYELRAAQRRIPVLALSPLPAESTRPLLSNQR